MSRISPGDAKLVRHSLEAKNKHTSNVVKEDVNVSNFLEVLNEGLALVVQSPINTKFLHQPIAFVVRASESINLGASSLTQLARDCAYGTCSSRNDHNVTLLDLRNVFHTLRLDQKTERKNE